MARSWFLPSGSAFADRFAQKVAAGRRAVGASVRNAPPVRVAAGLWGEFARFLTELPGYRVAAFLVKVGVVGGFAYLAWGEPLLARFGYRGPGWWYFDFVLWAYLVSVVAFAVVLPGFLVFRVLRGAWVSAFVAAGPLAVLAAALHFGYGFDAWRLQSWQWLAAGWFQGGSIEWIPVGLFALCHLAWLAAVLLGLRRALVLWRRLSPWFFVPVRIAVRLVVPVGVTWAVVDYSLGGASGVMDWTESRVETVLGQFPEVGSLVADGVVSRTWLVYVGGALSAVGLVAAAWYVCDVVAILVAYQLEVVASFQRTAKAGAAAAGGDARANCQIRK